LGAVARAAERSVALQLPTRFTRWITARGDDAKGLHHSADRDDSRPESNLSIWPMSIFVLVDVHGRRRDEWPHAASPSSSHLDPRPSPPLLHLPVPPPRRLTVETRTTWIPTADWLRSTNTETTRTGSATRRRLVLPPRPATAERPRCTTTTSGPSAAVSKRPAHPTVSRIRRTRAGSATCRRKPIATPWRTPESFAPAFS